MEIIELDTIKDLSQINCLLVGKTVYKYLKNLSNFKSINKPHGKGSKVVGIINERLNVIYSPLVDDMKMYGLNKQSKEINIVDFLRGGFNV